MMPSTSAAPFSEWTFHCPWRRCDCGGGSLVSIWAIDAWIFALDIARRDGRAQLRSVLTDPVTAGYL